jgi:Spy/CpxP family protein refolding chaperone
MMKPSLLFSLGTTVLSMLGLMTALAQEPGEGPPGPGPGGPPPRLEQVLGLSADQKTALDALRKEQREAARPLFEEQGRLDEQLRKALEATPPDPMTVGQRAIAANAARQRLKALDDSFHQRLVEMLDSKQRQKLQLLDQMRPTRPGPPPPPPDAVGPESR